LDALREELNLIARHEPSVRALIDFDREAVLRRAAEATLRAGGSQPLAGWSVAVKDVIDAAGLPTRCNSPLTPDTPANADAPVVARLKASGVFVTAKSVTASFAFLDPGPTRNPWRLDYTPGGSSSGSAAAVAAGFVRVAVGTQTGGSIVRPASFCGVVGFKPTFGTLPTEGVFPLAPSLDTVGLFTASVRDAQVAFAALVSQPVAADTDRPLRIAVLEDIGCEPAEPTMIAALRLAADRLRAEGHSVQSATLPPSAVEAHGCHGELMAAEAAHTHRDLFARRRDGYPPLLAAFIVRGQGVSAARLDDVKAQRARAIADLTRWIGEFDLAITPAAPGPAPRGLVSTGDHRMNRLWTYAGFPALGLPATLDPRSLPLGVQIIGAPARDSELFASTQRVERALAFSHRPQFQPGPGATE
jgi:Asp-tRNA(Asn)/Glu-tRNA(Gln) amidotransferase A subunit family amidase